MRVATRGGAPRVQARWALSRCELCMSTSAGRGRTTGLQMWRHTHGVVLWMMASWPCAWSVWCAACVVRSRLINFFLFATAVSTFNEYDTELCAHKLKPHFGLICENRLHIPTFISSISYTFSIFLHAVSFATDHGELWDDTEFEEPRMTNTFVFARVRALRAAASPSA